MTAKENRNIKDSVFVDLFYSDETAEANERSLYEAISGHSKLDPHCKIRKFRVDQQIYMNFQNDISFEVDQKILVFGEHQSTINMNMPLRYFMICGRALEMLIPVRSRYKRGLVKIPKPEFYTFYNGEDTTEKERILRLSDAFLTNDAESHIPSVELPVRVININPSAGHEILEKCPILRDYGEFVQTIRKYQKSGTDEPYKHAIRECIDNGVLSEYLRRRGSEVENMLMTEYDYKTDIEVQREEAEEIGERRGEQRGIEIGEQRGIEIGKQAEIYSSIRKLHQKGWTTQEIAEFVEMSSTDVEKIIRKKHM